MIPQVAAGARCVCAAFSSDLQGITSLTTRPIAICKRDNTHPAQPEPFLAQWRSNQYTVLQDAQPSDQPAAVSLAHFSFLF